ncbi:MAG TPA: DUF6356 family protein [Sphingomicrobium sp.]|nr:DUF6356 family protein [Sphingomicrobium sp.]
MNASRSNWADRLFAEHPRSLQMSWVQHGAGAAKIGLELIAVGLACLVHALVPGLFTQTAGNTIARLHAEILERQQGESPNPSDREI